jgi:hypothetical protein
MFKRRYAPLGFVTWKLEKRRIRRRMRGTRMVGGKALPLVAGGIAAAGLAAVAWRVMHHGPADASA